MYSIGPCCVWTSIHLAHHIIMGVCTAFQLNRASQSERERKEFHIKARYVNTHCHTLAYVHVHTYVCTYINMCKHDTYICTCTHTHICTYVCVFIRKYCTLPVLTLSLAKSTVSVRYCPAH